MMHVKQRALLLVTLLIVFLVVFCLYVGTKHYSYEIQNDVQEQEKLIHSITEDIKKYSYHTYHFQITNFISDNSEIGQSFADRNRERLYELCAPLLRRFREENPFFHAMDFNLPDGTVFLRVQKPQLSGDNILDSRKILSSVHNKQQQEFGFDIGKHGAIYWVAEPIFHDGMYVGAVEFGIEAKQIEQALSKALGGDVSSVLRAEEWQKAELRKKGFQELGDYVLMTHGNTLFDKIPSDIDLSILHDQHIAIDNSEYILHNCSTLFDFRGKVIGRVLLLQDISRKMAGKKAFILQTLILGCLLILCSFVIIYFSFNVLIGRLETYAMETRKAKEDLQEAHDKLESRVKERTNKLQSVNELLQKEIHDRQQYQVKLEKHQKHLRAVTSEMLAIEDKQRQQIAVDIHDQIGQSLSFCRMSLDYIQDLKDVEDIQKHVSQISEVVQQTLQDTRSLTFELCPPVLHELGLGAALEWLAEMMEERYGLYVSVECSGLDSYTDSPVLTMGFRSIRELLMNVVRHAGTNRAWVKIWTSGNELLLIKVSDKGGGFDKKVLELEDAKQGGYGLFSIRERMINIGGEVTIDSAEGNGTSITLSVPLGTQKDK